MCEELVVFHSVAVKMVYRIVLLSIPVSFIVSLTSCLICIYVFDILTIEARIAQCYSPGL
jgi:hypothetical protein